MKKVVICLALAGGLLLAARLTFAQEAQPPVESDSATENKIDEAIGNDSSTQNQDYSNDSNGMAPETQGNSDTVDMPVNTDNNSVNSADGG